MDHLLINHRNTDNDGPSITSRALPSALFFSSVSVPIPALPSEASFSHVGTFTVPPPILNPYGVAPMVHESQRSFYSTTNPIQTDSWETLAVSPPIPIPMNKKSPTFQRILDEVKDTVMEDLPNIEEDEDGHVFFETTK